MVVYRVKSQITSHHQQETTTTITTTIIIIIIITTTTKHGLLIGQEQPIKQVSLIMSVTTHDHATLRLQWAGPVLALIQVLIWVIV